MSKTNWGVIAAVGVVVAIIVWAMMDGNRPGDPPLPDAPENAAEQDEPSVADTGQEPGGGDSNGASDVESVETTQTAEGAAPSEAAQPATDAALQEEAESYVEQLAEPTDEPLRIEHAEGFAGPQQTLAGVPAAGGGEAAEAPAAGDVDPRTPAAPGSGPATPDAPLPEQADGSAPQAATGAEPEKTTAVATSAAGAAGADVRPETAGGETATDREPDTRIDLPVTEAAPVTIAELLSPLEDIPPDTVFYVHTVQPENDQGIWGIVHSGIVENFAEGVAVHRGETTETYQVDIPPHADEREPDSSSSFLGKLIYEKTRQSYVYNYETNRLGRNPDVIYPGQEIVIVRFSPEELISIYKHFARGEGQ